MTRPSSPATMDRIAVRPLGAREGQLSLLSTAGISYAFLGSAAPEAVRMICKVKGWNLDPRRVYVRTSRGIYWTLYRRLASLTSALTAADIHSFFPISRTCVVNALKIAGVDTAGVTPLLVFAAVDGQKEMLNVTRRMWPPLRDWLGLPRRGGGGPSAASYAPGAVGDMQRPIRRSSSGQ